MKEPVLLIMAAGMGSRYGGLKQMDPIDAEGHFIMDFSIYDAIKAGFKKMIFIIKQEMATDFKEIVESRISKHVQVEYVYQNLGNLPEGFQVPEGRVKPWGTGHAVLSCTEAIDGPFAVINADDYYGANAYKMMYEYLAHNQDDEKYRYAMVGYILENTLTENGHVARGVCEIDKNGMLCGINERIRIEKHQKAVEYTEDDGNTWTEIAIGSTVSMNMWGFNNSFLIELNQRFISFLNTNVPGNPLKAEYFLPTVVGELLNEQKATVKILKSMDKWYGVTYKEDKVIVMNAISELKQQGKYPNNLWE